MNKIYSINASIVKIKGPTKLSMMEMVYVGDKKLVGEIISITNEFTTMQVYEITTSLKVGEPVYGTGAPLSVTLGPGIISSIFDGIERPLKEIEKQVGSFITPGVNITALDETKLWNITLSVKMGDVLASGATVCTVQETPGIVHKSLVPPNISGEVVWVCDASPKNIVDPIVKIKDDKGVETAIALSQKWPIRIPRPVKDRLTIDRPLVTGQRVIDSLFPIAKGGAAAIPGGFGAGKTMTQHQLAKWCDADIIVYVGCGERGNEMTQALEEFSELIDPRSGNALTDRTVLIANTSNMPVAAREASIYTGITLAEYYRDMGYHVAIMADSTSRWAEALREISGRLEEMPAEEGFPAYLPSRLSEFYERAGYMVNLNDSEGSVTIIGAVSPPGADFSEPVTQNTKRFTRTFLALDKGLAYMRHYPAINWNMSYSEYDDELKNWYIKNVGRGFYDARQRLANLLFEESNLLEIVKLVGEDILPDDQKLILETARIIRVGFLQQNAFHKEDTYVTLEKQYKMIKVMLAFYDAAKKVVAQEVPLSAINKTGLADKIIKIKYDAPNDNLSLFDGYFKEIEEVLVADKFKQ